MMKSIFKTFFLSLCIIANVNFAYAQTASILPPAKTTFVDQNGKPLVSGTVDFYIPLTTTRKTTWQDAAETIPNTNPVVLDSAGRALILGSGSYRQVVKDRNGNIIWDQVTSSAGTGSGGSTATGDGDLVGTVKPWAGMVAPNQYMFTYGQEISRTLFPALFTAITSSQAVFCNSGSPTLNGLSDTTNFWIGMTVELSCVGAGNTTIIGKTATTLTMAANANVTTNTTATFFPWGRGNGTTTFNLPDFRGQVLAGNNNMGGIASTNLTTAFFGSKTPNASGATGGGQSASISILQGNLPNLNFTVSGTIAVTASGVQSLSVIGGSASTGFAAGGTATTYAATTFANTVATPTLTAASGGSGTPISQSLVQPTITTNYIIKVTPDQNSSTASGVTSFGLMTGDIACGTGLLCTGNNVSVPLIANGTTGSGPIVLQTSASITTPTITSPTLVTPTLGVATATSINKVAITAPATSATLTIPDGVTLTGPAASGTAMTLGNNETVTGVKTFGAAGNVSKLAVAGTTSGSTVLNATATASGTLTLPAATDTLIGKATTDILTNKTLDSAGTGNVLKVSGVTVSAGQYPGETSTGNATTGNVGEYIESVIPSGTPVSLSTGVGLDVTTITLTAGDWDVSANISYITAATTSVTSISTSLSGTLNTSDKTPGKYSLLFMAAVVPTASIPAFALPVGPYRMSVSGSTTVHLVANAAFSASTLTAYGIIRARRVR